MIKYEKALKGEEEKLVNFGNYVFSQSARPHDFRKLLPKVYKKGRENASCHYVAHDAENDIKAMVCCPVVDVNILEEHIKLGLVGTVSVHPYARSEGHMKHVMKLVHDDMKAKNVDVIGLGGQRQRYNYFLYEHAGANAGFAIDTTNVRHALKDVDESVITLKKLSELDKEEIALCYDLYEKGYVHGARNKDMYFDIMSSWTSDLLAVYKKGVFAGALVQRGNEITELLLKNEHDLYAVIKKWFSFNKHIEHTYTVAWAYEKERLKLLENLAESMEIRANQMLYILNFKNVLSAVMRLNEKCKHMQDGSVVVKIEQENIEISVKDNVSTVCYTDKAPQLTLDTLSAERMFFLPTKFLTADDEHFKNWLPLPWALPVPDHF